MRKVAFLTGTRADFGKIKSLIATLNEAPKHFETHIFATGMHMEPKYGYTLQEIEKCGFERIYPFINQSALGVMDRALANTLMGFADYTRLIRPDLIVVHGDRVEALAGALVGALNNILVAHIEGGEISGTVDELIRHSVSKMSHLHFVSNARAKERLVQLGEEPAHIHVIGSPEVDTMNSPSLPSLEEVRAHYAIPFARYGIVAFHPVTTNPQRIRSETRALLRAMLDSGHAFVVVYPNSDTGSEHILEEYELTLRDHPKVRLFPSLRFESMLVLLQHADFVLGNSSMGIREAPFYGVPTVNVGDRQQGRSDNPHLLHVPAEYEAISAALAKALALKGRLPRLREFGEGDSHRRFRAALEDEALWSTPVQKRFCELSPRLYDRSAA